MIEDIRIDGWQPDPGRAGEAGEARPEWAGESEVAGLTRVNREEAGMIRETGMRVAELADGMRKLVEANRGLADMLRVTNERLAAMEQAVRTLEKVTPQQAAEINRAIRQRAGEIRLEYGMRDKPDTEKAVAAEIRKAVREMTGVRTAREIARCDCGTVKEFIRGWEDYDVIQRIRRKERER